MWVPLAGCILIARYFTHDPGLLDAGTLGAMFAGIFLLGALYMAVGCFASSLTSNQIVAAMTTFAIGLGLFIAGYLADPAAPQQSWGSQVLGYMSMSNHMQDFARGVVDSGAVVFYVSWSFFFLYLTHRIVESRRWR
jgi:ABC-2 type transport system permease protein